MYILKVYSIHYTMRYNINVKKNSFGQNKRYKKFPEPQLVTVLLLICDSYMS